jgi:hypothetical protein
MPDSFLIAAVVTGAASLPDLDYAFFAAAFANRHRFFVAAMILFIPSGLIRRFAFGAFFMTGAGDVPLIAAHRFFCARAMQRRVAAERFLAGASGVVVAVSAGRPETTALSSAIFESICRCCSWYPRMAAVSQPPDAVKEAYYRP